MSYSKYILFTKTTDMACSNTPYQLFTSVRVDEQYKRYWQEQRM